MVSFRPLKICPLPKGTFRGLYINRGDPNYLLTSVPGSDPPSSVGEKKSAFKGTYHIWILRDFVFATKIPSRWCFQIFVIFIPNLGEMVQFDVHIFQMGLVQPPTSPSLARLHQYKSRPKPVMIPPGVVPVQEISLLHAVFVWGRGFFSLR